MKTLFITILLYISCAGIALSQTGIISSPYIGRRASDASAGTCSTNRKAYYYFNTTTNVFRFCNGTAWADLGGGSVGGYAVKITPGIHPTYGGNNVNHGFFYDDTVLTNVTGKFFWEGWVMPEANAEYFISDGFGGAHKILLGFGTGNPLFVSGNIWNATGAAVQSFSSLDSVPANTLHHIAVGWDGANIAVYVNGVRSNTIAYAGDRGNVGSSGVLFIGGSDHSNFKGWIFRVRGFEGFVPFFSGLPAGYFEPERMFRSTFRQSGGGTYAASFNADYTTSAATITDHSSGYDGSVHPGVLSLGNDDGFFEAGLKNHPTAYLPTFENKTFEQTAYAGAAPTTTPGNALLFDEFRRTDIVPAWYYTAAWPAITAPTGQVWSSNTGILSEKLYLLTNAATAVAVSHTQANVDITFTNGNVNESPIVYIRRNGTVNALGTTYLQISVQNLGGPKRVVLDEVVAGVTTTLAMSADIGTTQWSTLRIVANGTNVDVYRNGSLDINDATTTVTTGTLAAIFLAPLWRLDKIEAYPAS